MYTHSPKVRDRNSRAIANDTDGKKPSTEAPTQFADFRPEAENQKKLYALANNGAGSQRAAQLHSLANSGGKATIQREENNNGLPDQVKSGVEQLSGQSMSDVQVHYNSDKPAKLQAHAYAQGSDIHVASGQEKHLPHEAWHVAQQKQGRVKPTTQVGGVNVNDSKSLEKEADAMGKRALQMKSIGSPEENTVRKIGKAPVQRKLIYYNDAGIALEINTYAEVLTYLQSFSEKTLNPQKVVDAINAKLKGNLAFNSTLMDHFLASQTGYLTGTNAVEVIGELADFYTTHAAKMEQAAGEKEKGKDFLELAKLYKATEANDGEEIETEYKQSLACTLFALLAVKGSFMGADNPEELHHILMSLDKFKNYDDDNKVGLIRMTAGLSYATTYKGQTVSQMISSLKEKDQNRKFIIDLDAVAHTFALKFQGGKWKRFDNGSTQGYTSGMDIGSYGSKKISVIWE